METVSSYEDLLSSLKSTDKVLVDFFANWCGPCKQMEPVLERLSDQMNIEKVNIDEVPEAAQEFGVMGLPTLVVVENGEEIDRKTGFVNEAAIKELYQT